MEKLPPAAKLLVTQQLFRIRNQTHRQANRCTQIAFGFEGVMRAKPVLDAFGKWIPPPLSK
jgi:hypothetical protein